MNPNPSRIKEMFSSIAPAYDKTNDVLSFGIHHLWRRALVSWSEAKVGESVLDCATGTGDLALKFKEAVGDSGRVLATDFCEEMLLPGPAKAKKKNLQIDFAVADVTALPFPNATFDIASIAFGIRNVGNIEAALKEMARVLRPGTGRVMILEFGQPSNKALSAFYRYYSKHVLPKLGALLSGKPEAYKYLEESSAHFPCGENFLELIRKSGAYKNAECRPLSGGIAYMYKAWV